MLHYLFTRNLNMKFQIYSSYRSPVRRGGVSSAQNRLGYICPPPHLITFKMIKWFKLISDKSLQNIFFNEIGKSSLLRFLKLSQLSICNLLHSLRLTFSVSIEGTSNDIKTDSFSIGTVSC
uniref:Uncharacterized protein n=1 Tax=Cacopsylla melanoneura TaxID=428564 RepID=A0A8D9BSD3_9HEMI